jgi:hypothetical protein
MEKSDMRNKRITCPHCGKDITESVNKAVSSRAVRAWHAKHDQEYYRRPIIGRWAKKEAAEAEGKENLAQGRMIHPPLRRKTALYGVLNCRMRVVVVLE